MEVSPGLASLVKPERLFVSAAGVFVLVNIVLYLLYSFTEISDWDFYFFFFFLNNMQCKKCLSSRGASHVSPLEDEQENQHFMCAELAFLCTSTVRVDMDTCTGCWAGAEFPVDVKRSRSVHVMQSARSLKLSVY